MHTTMNTSRPGRLWCFEGVDGCGKTSLSTSIAEYLRRNEHEMVKHLSFPSKDGAVGQLIHEAFAEKKHIDPHAMLHLFMADAIDYEPKIQGWLREGYTLLVDRHTTVSGFVYQSEHHSVDVIYGVTQPALFTRPDAVFIVDVPPEVANARLTARGKAINPLYERVTDNEYVSRLRQRYIAYSIMEHAYLVDGTQPLEQLRDEVLSMMRTIEERQNV